MNNLVTPNEVTQKASEISAKIHDLTSYEGEDLRHEMQDLKKALLENPAACSLLLDEDIGLAVASLRRMVGIALAKAVAPKEKKVKEKKLNAKELAEAFKEIDDGEL